MTAYPVSKPTQLRAAAEAAIELLSPPMYGPSRSSCMAQARTLLRLALDGDPRADEIVGERAIQRKNEALDEALAYLRRERECLIDSATIGRDLDTLHDEDRETLGELMALIGRCRQARDL